MRTPKELGKAITAIRHEKGLTQKALAEKLNVTDKAISRWERGLGYPDIQLLEKLCGVLGIPVEKLLMQEEEQAFQEKAGTAAEEPLTDVTDRPDFGKDGERLRAIHEAYTEEREAYRRRIRKRNRILLAAAAVLLCGLLICLIPRQKRIDRTLYGEYVSEAGDVVPVRGLLKGRLRTWLFGGTYFKGDLSVSREADGDRLFEQTFTGRKTAYGSEAPGPLMKLESIYTLSVPVYLKQGNRTGQLSMLFSEDFSRVWIYKTDLLPGQVTAASDPDMDLQKVRERFRSIINVQE
ncbi:MAG: helix-turn-helix transcriptional regulator [Lachnospiraceae bacterium]|nr:helix-turn-helix transcriptional regulator [Lachnospiraceae bacterium]